MCPFRIGSILAGDCHGDTPHLRFGSFASALRCPSHFGFAPIAAVWRTVAGLRPRVRHAASPLMKDRHPMIAIKSPINIVAAFGLALGAVFGMAGTFVVQPNVQALLWAIDGAGLTMATALLALKYFRAGREFATPVRLLGPASAILLAITAARISGASNCYQPRRRCRFMATPSSS